MNRARVLVGLVATAALAGCQPETILDFAIGDLAGLWTADSYEYVNKLDANLRVDLVERDGAFLTLTVDKSVSPPIVSAVLDDGAGGQTSASGTVDIRAGTLMIGADECVVDHNGNQMTLTNSGQMFDFGSGPVPTLLVIRMTRL